MGSMLPVILFGFAVAHGLREKSWETFPFRETLVQNQDGIRAEVVGYVETRAQSLPNRRSQFTLRLEALTAAKRSYDSRHRLLVQLEGSAPSYGDRLRMTGKLHGPEPPRNPGQFDYQNYLKRQDISGMLEVGIADNVSLLEQRPNRFKALALKARDWMAAAITRDLDDESEIGGVLTAMVLGMRENASPDIEELFRHSGTLHIFAVSGLHVGIFALIVWLFLKPWRLGRARVALIILPCLFFYAFVTGWRPSAVRAATMAAIFLGAFCLNREPRLLNSLGVAALLILGFNTNQLFLPGFQLSFLVLLTIVLLTKPLQSRFRWWLYPDPLVPGNLMPEHETRAFYFRRWFGDIAGVSAAAWIGSLLIMAIAFHLITPIAVVANCFLMPLSFGILLTAALSMLCALIPFMRWANILFNNANFVLVNWLVGLAGWFSQWPGSHFVVSCRPPFTQAPTEITVMDVPRGGSVIHVDCQWGPDHLIDCGHEWQRRILLEPYLQHRGINRLDGLFLTHGDTAHVSAAPAIFQKHQPVIYQSWWKSGSPSIRRMNSLLESRPLEDQRLASGDTLAFGATRRYEILYPPKNDTFAAAGADNHTLVIRIVAHGWRVLLMSDAGFATEKWLLDSELDLTSDVLVKGQHADDVSGLPEFLQAVNPEALIIDTEEQPEDLALAWAHANGCQVLDQVTGGGVIIQLDDRQLRLVPFLGDQPVRLKRAR